MALATLVLGFALSPGGLLLWLLMGLIAGAVAGYLMQGSGFGIIGDIVVGILDIEVDVDRPLAQQVINILQLA